MYLFVWTVSMITSFTSTYRHFLLGLFEIGSSISLCIGVMVSLPPCHRFERSDIKYGPKY